MHIGLIGGIGPAATFAYHTRLIAAAAAAGVPLELTIVHADVDTLAANAGAGAKDAQAEIFARLLDRLAAAGAEVAALTALTAHFCYAETAARSPIPLVDAVAAVDAGCRAARAKTVGLLGSPPSMKTHLFGLLQTATITPQTGFDTLCAAYMAMARAGVADAPTKARFLAAGRETIAKGADAVLLGSTDMGLVYDGADPGHPVIDALPLHIDAILHAARS